jgi:hypothetical protein
MKVLVCGGRRYDNRQLLVETLDRLDREHNFLLLIHGAAPGADRMAGWWAKARGIQPVECPALWDFWRKRGQAAAAGPNRNHKMLLLQPDLVVAFPGGDGTANMVEIARRAGIKVIEVSGS